MAKKKDEDKLTYLQMPLPKGRKYYKMVKRSWSGLNYRQTIDTGALSMEHNISTLEAPYLVPSQKHIALLDDRGVPLEYEKPISMFGFDDFLIVIYREQMTNTSSIYVEYIHCDGETYDRYIMRDPLKTGDATEEDECPRCIVQFNTYIASEDIINGEYEKHLVILPDRKTMYFHLDDLQEDGFRLHTPYDIVREYYNDEPPYLPPEDADTTIHYKNTYSCEETLFGEAIYKYNADGEWKISVPRNFPEMKYATVHLSRLFGVSNDKVYASGFNDYTNWIMDSPDAYNESNAWCSSAQSNTKADGDFTGITNFQGHVVCFKRDFMHEIYNTKNPFRIQDIFADGAIDNRTIQDVGGKLIFVSPEGVKMYTGSAPKLIDYNLNIPGFDDACSGTDGRCYYLYCKYKEYKQTVRKLFVYDTWADQWSEQVITADVVSFAHNKNGMYMLSKDGYIYKLDTDNYDHNWSFETDLVTNQTVNIKHLKKIQMLVDLIKTSSSSEKPWLKVYTLYDAEEFDDLDDDEKAERLMYEFSGYMRKAIRVKPRKTANYGMKLHFEGYGYVRLYELELFIENGGDLYV